MYQSPQSSRFMLAPAALIAITAVLAGCGGSPTPLYQNINIKPSYLGSITSAAYDGAGDDLLTGGLGKTGLGSGTAPAIADSRAPSATELRRLAIYTNYRALLDPSAGGGFGLLYGPNVTVNGVATSDEGKIPGTEFLAYADDGSGRQNVTMMVQVPASFNPDNPCIVAGPSSGSRGVYGAIATAGEWGLKHGCAVAYTDKGTGNGIHDVQNNTVSLQNGVRADAVTAGRITSRWPMCCNLARHWHHRRPVPSTRSIRPSLPIAAPPSPPVAWSLVPALLTRPRALLPASRPTASGTTTPPARCACANW